MLHKIETFDPALFVTSKFCVANHIIILLEKGSVLKHYVTNYRTIFSYCMRSEPNFYEFFLVVVVDIFNVVVIVVFNIVVTIVINVFLGLLLLLLIIWCFVADMPQGYHCYCNVCEGGPNLMKLAQH